jgi:hypothetical protein
MSSQRLSELGHGDKETEVVALDLVDGLDSELRQRRVPRQESERVEGGEGVLAGEDVGTDVVREPDPLQLLEELSPGSLLSREKSLHRLGVVLVERARGLFGELFGSGDDLDGEIVESGGVLVSELGAEGDEELLELGKRRGKVLERSRGGSERGRWECIEEGSSKGGNRLGIGMRDLDRSGVLGFGRAEERETGLSEDGSELADTSVELSMGVLRARLESVDVDIFPARQLDKVSNVRLQLGSLRVERAENGGLDEGVAFRHARKDAGEPLKLGVVSGRRGEEAKVARERAEKSKSSGELAERTRTDELVEKSDNSEGVVVDGGRRSGLAIFVESGSSSGHKNLVKTEPPDRGSVRERDGLRLEELSPARELESTPDDDKISDFALERLERVISIGVRLPICGVEKETLESGDDANDGRVEVHREDDGASVRKMLKDHLFRPFLGEDLKSTGETTNELDGFPHLVRVRVGVEVVRTVVERGRGGDPIDLLEQQLQLVSNAVVRRVGQSVKGGSGKDVSDDDVSLGEVVGLMERWPFR